ncbi:MAG: segregation/condensation protein A [Eubacteriales bacterium]|nr:segregation/condensation protein A [Eubacteriales bacterium]MDD4390389.1 segregation/condensation protein A [Eubacteriales bacterium]
MVYKVKLSTFEGPFDLLVHLIENARMSIYDIKVSEITDQYIQYIDQMKKQEIEVATEFIVLAAALIEIKSRMLLPRTISGEEVDELADPREALVERILEYKKFKNAAAAMEEAEKNNMRIFEKPQEDITCFLEKPDEYLKMDINQFVNSFNLFLRRKQKLEDIRKTYTRLERQKISEEQKIRYIRALLHNTTGGEITFADLLREDESRYNTAVTFSSILEMAKWNHIELSQKRNFGPIFIKAAGEEGVNA